MVNLALKKAIHQDGVTTNYHRIWFVQQMVNQTTAIAVLSYIDDNAREAEQNGQTRQYKQAVTYQTDYQENMTVSEAYDYLKTLPEFEGAEDV
jgi:hypothetical protein